MLKVCGRFASVVTMLVAGGAFAQQPGSTDSATKASSSTVVGKIGIGTIGPAILPADLRIKLEDAAASGLRASGAQVASAAELSRARATAALGSCSDPVCERRLAEITDTRYWLRGTCQLDTSTYRLHLELVDARSGAVVAARDDTCDICTEADAADLTNVAASALKATLARAQTSPGAPAPAPPAVPNPPAGGTPDQKDAGPTTSDGPTFRRVLPWMLFAGAAAAVAGGVYAVHIDGDCFEKNVNCMGWYQTTWRLGVPLFAVAAALTTTGIVLLGTPPPAVPGTGAVASARARTAAPLTQFVISPGGVVITGRF